MEDDVRFITHRNAQPFLYDADTEQFILSGRRLDLKDIADQRLREYMVPRTETKDEAAELLRRTPLLLRTLGEIPLSTPLFNEALENGMFDEALREETLDVMMRAFATLSPHDRPEDIERLIEASERLLYSEIFSIDLAKDSYGHNHLFTKIGGAACVCLQTYDTHSGWDPRENVTQYVTHNAPHIWQRQVLLTGMGHIAYKIVENNT